MLFVTALLSSLSKIQNVLSTECKSGARKPELSYFSSLQSLLQTVKSQILFQERHLGALVLFQSSKAIKKTRKKGRKQELDQEKKKKLSFFLVFLFSYFLVFFYKFPPLAHVRITPAIWARIAVSSGIICAKWNKKYSGWHFRI